jgi:hypothetical protein
VILLQMGCMSQLLHNQRSQIFILILHVLCSRTQTHFAPNALARNIHRAPTHRAGAKKAVNAGQMVAARARTQQRDYFAEYI